MDLYEGRRRRHMVGEITYVICKLHSPLHIWTAEFARQDRLKGSRSMTLVVHIAISSHMHSLADLGSLCERVFVDATLSHA